MSNEPKLLPCPFCGGETTWVINQVFCNDCEMGSSPNDAFEMAVKKWNRRVPAPAVPDDVAKTVAELRKAYALVAEFPESKPDGFMNLLALRNLTPDAADTIEALAASVDRANAANEALCADVEAQAAELARLSEALREISETRWDAGAAEACLTLIRQMARAALTQPTGEQG